ncbi:hypothetical protein ACP4OV_027334 [Aristida adscensionis]
MAAAIKLLYLLLLCICSHALVPPRSNTSTDELALLSFKSALSSGQSSLLASWNTSNHFCSWPGVVCGRRHPERVISLIMDGFKLSGRISPSLGNMSFLRVLELGNNQLTGEIPPELSQLSRLQVPNLSTNHLQGEIPAELGVLKNLAILRLDKNVISGEIPGSLGDLPAMEALYLSYNKLSGEIPPSLGNLTNLFELHLTYNTLSGVIPPTLGRLSELSLLSLGFNNLTGENMLRGVIPPNAFCALPYLQKISLDHNQFHGHVPASIANSSNLLLVQLGVNSFSGIIPSEVGRLKNLIYLDIERTLVEAKDPKGWEFISALTNCSNLKVLALLSNNLGGILPDSLSNLSSSLQYLYLQDNAISGSIPKDISNLVSLQALLLFNNSITGTLPSSLGRFHELQVLYLDNNKLSGSIQLIGNLTELSYLAVDTNTFSGRIPGKLGNLTKLMEFSLSENNLTGPIPSEIFNIHTILSLDVSNNNLEGSIPQEIGNLKNLVQFAADSNKFSGEIPSTLGYCQLLRALYLQNNVFSGRIPSLLSQLKGLEILDLSSNNLSGQIPEFLGNISMLYYLNLSFNSFVGKIPNFGVFANATAISIQGNNKLCGGIPHLHFPPCYSDLGKTRHKFPLIPVVIPLTSGTIILFSLFCIFLSWRKNTTNVPSMTSIQGHPFISYPQLVRATDGFSMSNLLGSGTFGTVFKGNIETQDDQSTSLVAVKVLKLQSPGALKSFSAECEALRNIRHRNLVKIITACSSIDSRGNDFKAIVFDFMPNGSLEGWLHPNINDQEKYLNLPERISILLDVAYALDYLHVHGPTPVAHCDLKSSNVLLDADMVAHYGAGNMVSTNGDIYSYGIIVLETITGKRPTDNVFQGSSLREYVELGLRDGVKDIVDMRLSSDLENRFQTGNDSLYRRKMDCIVSLLRLGMSCSVEMPSSRMSIGDIIKELLVIKETAAVEDARHEEGRN